ncbi:GMC family oxidoreductase N-terminal domain-containing protein [Alphaproteobacteria bacterium]|jgi:choline dehydrogenase-like flavoprotein|nr:GMC family oxidoreductase N-terminal domain-containing protein [Alphaproteobacteria bacterium]MDB2478670.1 GMC family oxidoreductase N-terminal domain-containing protein [Alphaproteobacteria bacterium]MDC1035108.1 GMC family oxidoreductase N-terminal domain-containing protein [Alphaproteobacteria bacterium]
MSLQFDFIIVGAGTAGCLLANRLSANGKYTVALLEAGGSDNYHWVHIPVGYLYCMGNKRTDWLYKTTKQKGLNGRELNYPRGKVMGGCSSINGMIYMRGQANDYDQWRQMGNEGWSWDDVLPYFKNMEDSYEGENKFHGSGGEWKVNQQRLSWEVLDSFKEATIEAGIPQVDDFNEGNNFGVSYFKVNQNDGLRWNTVKAFLKPVKNRKNLRVISKCEVSKIILKNKKAKGVKVFRNGKSEEIYVNREIILSSGSIGSPKILELSGIGNPNILSKLGIDTEVESKNIGENLQDHLQLRVIYELENAKTLNQKANSFIGKLGIGLEYALKRTGPMSMAPSQLGLFAMSDKSHETPNLQFHVQPLSLDKFGEPLHNFPGLTASVCNLNPQSRGNVHIVSKDYKIAPSIDPNYLSAEKDKIVAAQSIKLARKIISQPAMKKYNPKEYAPGIQFQSEDDLKKVAGDIGTTIFHPVGTCAMGTNVSSVTDSNLKVRGVEGLRIADASIMPTITSGNTNAPTLMIAEKASEMILKSNKI